MLRSALLTTLLALSPLALADVRITSPAAGASIPAGPITIQWEDSGDAPLLSDLTSYTIQLMVGGNDDTATPLITIPATPPGLFSAGNSVQGTIPAGVAGSTPNGYYLRMMSVATEGGQVINFSNRFTMTGMTGVTPPSAVTAVTNLNGVTDGPATVNQVSNNAGAGAGGAPEAGVWTVPYQLQTGLTKYAPMQPVPPTKITKRNATPQHPTSAYTIATTFMGPARILTTLTASQTFSVHSMENTAAPVAGPSGDMAKFLNRWKD